MIMTIIAPQFIFQYFRSIEPVFDVLTVDDDPGMIELPWGTQPLIAARRHYIVERAGSPFGS